jgi:hypothetical protein
VSYPKRPQMFAYKFCRQLIKQAVAQEIGPEGFCLLTCVVMTEDAKGYTGAVTFFNGQLMPLCGFTTEKRLISVRQKCVESGWLHYQAGSKGVAGKYWCVLPVMNRTDGPVDENPNEFSLSNSTAEVQRKDREKTEEVARQVQENDREKTGQPTVILPTPIPKPFPVPEGASAVVESWNLIRELPKCQKLSGKRLSALNARLTDPWWRENWATALARIPRSRFLLGDNKTGWKADFDWFIQPDSVLRISESKYDDRRTNSTQRNPSFRHADDAAEDWNVADAARPEGEG